MAADSSKTRSLSENDDCCITTPPLLPLPVMLVMVLVIVLAMLVGLVLVGVMPIPNPSCSQEATTLVCGNGNDWLGLTVTRWRAVSTKKSISRNQSSAPSER